jgi:hypothetical protein
MKALVPLADPRRHGRHARDCYAAAPARRGAGEGGGVLGQPRRDLPARRSPPRARPGKDIAVAALSALVAGGRSGRNRTALGYRACSRHRSLIFEHFGVGLWVPEAGGPIAPGSEAHDLAMTLFGSQSKAVFYQEIGVSGLYQPVNRSC